MGERAVSYLPRSSGDPGSSTTFTGRNGRSSPAPRRSPRAAEAAVERAGALRAKADELLRQIGTVSEERQRLIETWEEEYPYDAASAPGPGEGEAIASAVRRLERDLRALGPVDWGALSEDTSLASRVAYLGEQLADVRAAMDELRAIIAETDRHVGVVFTGALDNINVRFDALFRRLFGGGEARLQLLSPPQPGQPDANGEDEAQPEQGESAAAWDRGVEIVARPPGKHLQNLAQLSGGEQTLTAIAYLFASMEVAGVPLAVLDEVDAALDESNLLRFGELAREYACPSEEASERRRGGRRPCGLILRDSAHRDDAPEGDHGAGRHSLRRDARGAGTLESGRHTRRGLGEPGTDPRGRRAPTAVSPGGGRERS